MSEPIVSISPFQDNVILEKKREYYIVKHNDLIRKNTYIQKNKGNSLSLLEQKIMLYIISKIKPDDEELIEQTFDILEFCQVCGIDTDKNKMYSHLKYVIGKLKSRTMWLIDEENETETTLSWIVKASIKKRDGKIKIKLDEDLKPFLLMLSSNYTQYSFHNVFRMKSKYGIMLFELLKSYSHKGECVTFTIEQLKECLDCTTYSNFTNFSKKVLLPALQDINTYSELKVEAEYIKTGRTYTQIKFFVHNLSPKKREELKELNRRYYNSEIEIGTISESFAQLMGGDNGK